MQKSKQGVKKCRNMELIKPSVAFIVSLADLRGPQGRPGGSKFFHFHAELLWQKIYKIIGFWELAPPPQENPGSTTEIQ